MRFVDLEYEAPLLHHGCGGEERNGRRECTIQRASRRGMLCALLEDPDRFMLNPVE